MTDEHAQAIAGRDWFTLAHVRIREDWTSQSLDPAGVRHFVAGEECDLIQWGRWGEPVMRDVWWDTTDIDGAHIIPAEKVEVLAILDEVSPE